MSTLFAMSQVALFGRDLGAAPEGTSASTSDSSLGAPTGESTSTVGWSMPEPSASSTSQPARWRINSGDLEEMMLRAAAGLGLDRGSRSATTQLKDGSPPLSRDDTLEDRENVVGFPTSCNSRGSSPLYRKHLSDYQDHNLDATAPSSPCTPSIHMRSSLSAVSPTSSRSEEAAFQHQLSLEADSRVPTGTPAARAGLAPHGGAPGSTSGRFGLKLLVSNSMAGTLIGKGGTRICEIKDECLADIKVTPNGRFYPGTHERVVLVVGEPGSVQMACDRIVTTIYTAADTSLDITQRVLIPDAASGLIIGHDGVRLGDLRQEAGVASIQVSPRDMCTVAGERVVTLQGPMSAVILGLTLIVDRMMEDTTASRYQNMSTIYRAVHLHLPPYAVPGGGMHDGSSPRHPSHPRLSPSYGGGGSGGPSPHSQHEFHSPGAVAAAAARGAGREYGNNGNGGATQWEFGYGGGSNNPAREMPPHGTGGSAGAGPGSCGPAEYHHRSMSMPAVHVHEMGGSPSEHHHHRGGGGSSGSSSSGGGHPVPGAHFGDRLSRQSVGSDRSPRDFEFSEVDVRGRGGGGVDLDDRRREYDSPSPADLSRPVSRDGGGYLHHSPRLPGPAPGPSPRDFEHMRHQQKQQQHQHGNEAGHGFLSRGSFPGATSQSEFLPLQQQQQRLRQQQQQQQPLARPSSDYSHQDATAGMLVHEARAAAAAAAAVTSATLREQQQQQHRGMHEGGSSTLHRTCSASMHGNIGGGNCGGGGAGGGIGSTSPPHIGGLRHSHSLSVGSLSVGGGLNGADGSGLAGMFDSMNLNSPHGLVVPGQSPSSGALQQGQAQGQAGGVNGGAGCIVHGELPVPDADVGIILGKGGATVRELQQLSGAKIMIARRNEFMPGTKHRLVTLAGPPLAVNMARFLIMRKIQTEKEKL